MFIQCIVNIKYTVPYLLEYRKVHVIFSKESLFRSLLQGKLAKNEIYPAGGCPMMISVAI